MNKKIIVISILSVFMLLAIAFASTVTSNTQKPPKKESPLFRIRTRHAIREKIGDLMSRFVGERVFFLPFQWFKNRINLSNRQRLNDKTAQDTNCITGCITECVIKTCQITSCGIFTICNCNVH